MNVMTSGGDNMKGTIYGNGLPRGTQVKKTWGQLTYVIAWCNNAKDQTSKSKTVT
jgi:hypothetical protein